MGLVRTLVVVVACLGALAPSAPASGTSVSTGQVVARFKTATGEALRQNVAKSYPGHYVALDLGAPSISKRARYGTFTVYVVVGSDTEEQVHDLLADAHTGVLGDPGAASLYWESGTTLTGDHYWLAKKRYGANVVLTWIGSKDTKKIEPSFARLHRALQPLASS